MPPAIRPLAVSCRHTDNGVRLAAALCSGLPYVHQQRVSSLLVMEATRGALVRLVDLWIGLLLGRCFGSPCVLLERVTGSNLPGDLKGNQARRRASRGNPRLSRYSFGAISGLPYLANRSLNASANRVFILVRFFSSQTFELRTDFLGKMNGDGHSAFAARLRGGLAKRHLLATAGPPGHRLEEGGQHRRRSQRERQMRGLRVNSPTIFKRCAGSFLRQRIADGFQGCVTSIENFHEKFAAFSFC